MSVAERDPAHLSAAAEMQTVDELGGDDLSEIPNEFDKSLYCMLEKTIRVDQLVPFRKQVRSVSTPHVDSIYDSLGKYGNDYSIGMISVVERVGDTSQFTKPVLPKEFWEGTFGSDGKDAVTLKDVEGYEDGDYLVSYVVINGLHRRDALMRKCLQLVPEPVSERKTALASEFGVVRVKVVQRLDGKPLSGYKVTVFGGNANERTSRIRKPTFLDQLHLSMSFLQEIRLQFPTKDICARKLAKKLHTLSMVPSLSEATIVKYSRIAITFVKRPALYQKFYKLSESADAEG